MTPAELRMVAAELARDSRIRQGLPPTVEEPAVLASVAALVAGGREPPERAKPAGGGGLAVDREERTTGGRPRV
jgi:hypothetical protein